MSAVDFNIKIDGIDVFSKRLRNVIYNIDTIDSMFTDIEVYARKSWINNFKEEGRPTKWAELSASRIAQRKAKGKDAHPILQDTGDLLRSVEGNNEKSISNKTKKSIEFGVSGAKAVATNYIAYTGKSARKWFMLQDSDKMGIVTILRKYITKDLKK